MNGNRLSFFVATLALLASVSGFLMSKASLIGRLGMTYVYKEYRFLKTWWKGTLIVFAIWMIVLLIQWIIARKLAAKTARWIHLIFMILALAGLYFTYADFQHTTSHRWLREKFHLGAYLFWIGWIATSIFCLIHQPKDLSQ